MCGIKYRSMTVQYAQYQLHKRKKKGTCWYLCGYTKQKMFQTNKALQYMDTDDMQ